MEAVCKVIEGNPLSHCGISADVNIVALVLLSVVLFGEVAVSYSCPFEIDMFCGSHTCTVSDLQLVIRRD